MRFFKITVWGCNVYTLCDYCLMYQRYYNLNGVLYCILQPHCYYDYLSYYFFTLWRRLYSFSVLFQLQSFEWTTSQHLLPSIFWLLIYILKSIGDWNLYIYLSVSYGNAKMFCSSSYLWNVFIKSNILTIKCNYSLH